MTLLNYDTVASFCMTFSLLLFVALFSALIIYVFFVASTDRLDNDQRKALDLDPSRPNNGGHR